jgi:hypothetical protein
MLLRARWPFRPVGALILLPPISWLAAGVYRLIANNRYRLPGGTPACAVPQARPAPTPAAEPAAEPRGTEENDVALDDLLGRD